MTQGDLPLGLQEVSRLQFLPRYSSLNGQGDNLGFLQMLMRAGYMTYVDDF